jgi:hypothetical protein
VIQKRNGDRHLFERQKTSQSPFLRGATWELRFGPNNRFQVFYEIDHLKRVVRVLAIGVKERERLVIGGEEFEL